MMNLIPCITALARQPGIGYNRIIKLNGIDSLVDPVGAMLIFCGVHPLDLQYYCNVPNEKLWNHFKDFFIYLDIDIQTLGLLFHLVDTELPRTLTPKERRDRVIQHIYLHYKNQHENPS